ncbi:glycosyltransferase [bacterium 3DAC]|nr:glycosyltransferase [Dictyoglomota bacterium]UZN23286.1 glycosyltransferase [bacterium 3DAC]
MQKKLSDYRRVIGDKEIYEIYKAAKPLLGKHVVHINSTYQGGGVAEMLNTLIPLMNSIGIKTGWRILHGTPEFFNVTKSFHNALQGADINLTNNIKKIYEETVEAFSVFTHLDHDFVIVHDPQPLPLISFYKKSQPWIWRCHIDITNPNKTLWEYLKGFILAYDTVIISSEKYKKDDLPNPQVIFYPSIDPLSEKNRDMTPEEVDMVIKKYGIKTDKPIITQISRFDPWKDPVGVIEVFKKVKQSVDARLVLLGNMASDDPEGWKIYREVEKAAKDLIKTGDVLLLTVDSSTLVNALQRKADVVIQKSTREGFGLTVTEAMWKKKAVVASRVGGITLQIEDGVNGFLHDPYDYDGFANTIVKLLEDKALAEEIGQRAHETVKEKFLITRLLKDYLNLLSSLM